jgi:hypothetical protein
MAPHNLKYLENEPEGLITKEEILKLKSKAIPFV